MKENVRLRQERGALIAEMQKLVDGPNALSASKREEFMRIEFRIRALGAQIDEIESGGVANFGRPPEMSYLDAPQRQEPAEYRKAFTRYLRHGLEGITPEDRSMLMQQRATLGVEGTPTGGSYPGSSAGYVVPVGFSGVVEAAMAYAGSAFEAFRVVQTPTGAPLSWPLSDDLANEGEIITEGSAQNVQDVPTAQLVLGSFKYSSKVIKVSWEVEQDAGIDVAGFIANTVGVRLGRKLNRDFTIGAGTTEPLGLIPALLASGATPVLALGAHSNDNVSGANTIGSDDLLKLMHSVDPVYRKNGSFMMNDSTLSHIMQVKDQFGRPIFTASLNENEPDRIYGKRVFIAPSMDTLQTSASSPTVTKNTGAFGDMSKYLIRRASDMTIRRLSELYALNGQVGYLAYARYDGALLDAGSHPVNILQNTF